MSDSVRADDSSPGSETRPLFVVAFGPALATVAVALVVGAIVLLTSSTGLGALLPAVAGLWLAVHQVPVTISDITLGVLPLAPTALVVLAVARAAARAGGTGRSLAELRSVLLCAVAGPAFVTAVAIAVVNDAAGRYTIATPPPLTAFCCTVAVHLGGALIGLAPAYWRPVARRLHVPGWVAESARIGGRALAALLAVGAVITLVRLIWQWQTVLELVRSGNDAVGMIGLAVLSLLYLPNVMIGAAALPLGVDTAVGPITMSVFSAAPGRAPGLPILAVLPEGPTPWFLLALLVVPAVIAGWVGRRCADRSLDLGPTLVSVAAAAVCVAVGFTGAAFVAGGTLGGVGYAGVDLPRLFLYTLGWFALVAVLAALLLQQAGESRLVRAVRREASDAESAGYTTYPDEADDRLERDEIATAVTEEFDPVDRAESEDAPAVEADDDAEAEAEAEAEADTGDFDALADAPTEEVRPARRPAQSMSPAVRRRPGGDRDRLVADVEELDSYTFGQ